MNLMKIKSYMSFHDWDKILDLDKENINEILMDKENVN